jgi:hypothetical protein
MIRSAEERRGHVPQGRLSIGHCPFEDSVSIHLMRQCIWKTCVQAPQTVHTQRQQLASVVSRPDAYARNRDVLRGQSSPGILQSGQVLSNASRQIPQTSSSSSDSSSPLVGAGSLAFPGVERSQRQTATGCQFLMLQEMRRMMVLS